MTTQTWLMYVGTVLIFMSTPGPSHLLMLSTSLSSGFERSLATAAGDLCANALQMLLAGLGLAAIVTGSQFGFALVKWAGVAYLVWMGIAQIARSFRPMDARTAPAPATLTRLWLRGFLTSAANPKAIVFFAALFPQFLEPQRALGPQIALLGTTYLAIDGLFLAFYGKTASWLRTKLEARYRAVIDRAAGVSLITAALLLGLRSSNQS